jgi:predicted CopG family antitoxin
LNVESNKTHGFKTVLLSPETHARLAEMTNKKQIFNDVITELLNMKIRAEGLKNQKQVGPLDDSLAPVSKEENGSHG